MYHISTISDILRQGVDSLAQWLEHWIFTPAVRVRIPSGTWDFFQVLVTNFHIRKRYGIDTTYLQASVCASVTVL